jgi:molybdate transport system substrate-binding protein
LTAHELVAYYFHVTRRRFASPWGLTALLFAVALGTVAACQPVAVAPSAADQAGELRVFAAASLTDAFAELGLLFERQNPGSRAVFNYGPSSGLRVQLEQGAPADVFASADDAQMDQARAAGLISGEPRPFVRNHLLLIVPRDNPGRVESLGDLARPGLRLVTTHAQVPVGAYTRQLLAKLSQDPEYGPDFAPRVLANVRSEEENVRGVVAKVTLGEADGGVVYTSDVTPKVATEVHLLPIPEQFDVVATYPIAVVQGTRQSALAQRFLALVLSPEGQAVLARWGFQPVLEPTPVR